jgi:hypothetical protein
VFAGWCRIAPMASRQRAAARQLPDALMQPQLTPSFSEAVTSSIPLVAVKWMATSGQRAIHQLTFRSMTACPRTSRSAAGLPATVQGWAGPPTGGGPYPAVLQASAGSSNRLLDFCSPETVARAWAGIQLRARRPRAIVLDSGLPTASQQHGLASATARRSDPVRAHCAMQALWPSTVVHSHHTLGASSGCSIT